jgi:putative DNA methylase
LEEDARLTALFLWTLQSTSAAETNGGESEAEEENEDGDEEEGSARTTKMKGLRLVFDVVRRFSQPLGIRLPDWEGRIIETEKGVVRLLPVHERARQLFGADGAQSVASRLEREAKGNAQLVLFPEQETALTPVAQRGRRQRRRGTSSEAAGAPREATTLDRVHAAILLQASGQANALRAMLQTE